MLLLIAAVALGSLHQESATSAGQSAGARAMTADASVPASLGAARAWLALLDEGRWQESWRLAADLFRLQIAAPQWTAAIQPVRQPLGPTSSRVFQAVTRAGSLPGVPAGIYDIIQFRTTFARRSGAVETITLVRENGAWKVAGYFIR